jgi:hypothetical protein
MKNANRTSRLLTLGAFVLCLAPRVEAGPPLICHPFDAGASPLLSWGTGPGWNTPDRAYDVRRLTSDTMQLLAADAPVLARMENLRRATIYASSDRAVAGDLLAAVLGRALSAVADGRHDARAWFDAAYLVEAFRQMRLIDQLDMMPGRRFSSTLTAGQELDGNRFMARALELAGTSPEMEFAASLMQHGAAAAEHRRRALAGAPADSLLARNIRLVEGR